MAVPLRLSRSTMRKASMIGHAEGEGEGQKAEVRDESPLGRRWSRQTPRRPATPTRARTNSRPTLREQLGQDSVNQPR